MFSLFKKKPQPKNKAIVSIEKHQIAIGYSYEWKEEIPESERDTKEFPSRPFCKKLMELNRVYTRADIEKISQRLGYSVFERCGGDGCRHYWKSNIVVKNT